MELKTPQREFKTILCPNTPIKKGVNLFKIKTSDQIDNIDSIYKMMNESSNDIIGVKFIEGLSSQKTKYFSVMSKMNIYEFKDWIKDINYELNINNIEFKHVV